MVSFIQPMFHLKPKPSPPREVGRDTAGQDVDSSATIMTSGWCRYTTSLISLIRSMASRFSRPPKRLVTHSPSCLLYTSDAADEEDSVDLGGRRIIKKKKKNNRQT